LRANRQPRPVPVTQAQLQRLRKHHPELFGSI
jgi:hypothetical protein